MTDQPEFRTIDDVAAWVRRMYPDYVRFNLNVTADNVNIECDRLARKDESGRTYSMRTLNGAWSP